MLEVRSVVVGDWQEYRDIRLRALLDSPDAFGSTYEAEVVRTDEQWQARIAAASISGNDRVLFAMYHERVCGLTWCKLSASVPEEADLFQMWVDPASRGAGAGRALLAESLAWARNIGARRVRLGVTAADSPAMRLYTAHGFRPAGSLEPLRDGSCLFMQEMVFELEQGPSAYCQAT
ncbi:GNAT family N-acetyltransferase [Stutzerimonas stutzeri]|uniref:GNAT family N-acetyltransferase n=1 Tax=Stutzerimonas stutzeri TaxID=316 RepID=UPI00210EFC59|nr:GNAT family N-acetyltransferase [Stutzerimonas stutzeri]MCQ4260594.1 GNAT family N-acetyltransferase [Stutzerimonas stutzeri]